MAATIVTKNSSTAGAVPTASDLVQGELAVNVTDKALYTENASGTVVKLNAPSIVDNGNATAITIDSSENVGIGTSSPSTFGKFAVVNSSATSTTQFANSNVWAISNASNADSNIAISNGVDHSAKIGIYNGANLYFALDGAEKMRIDSSGNVGIGTSSPGSRLTIAGNTEFRSFDGTTLGYVNGSNGTAGLQFDVYGSNTIKFTTAGSERVRIDSSGNLLVGTTDTTLYNNTSGNGFTYVGGELGVARDSTCAYFNRMGSDGANIGFFNRGNGVGSVSTTASATAYNTSSDYRLKENISPMVGAIEKVAALKPCTYTWKATGETSQGFIAHELAEVVPECVTGEKDAVDSEGKPVYQGIDTSFLVATLTAAIQELKAIVDAQAVEIAALKGQA